MEVVTAFEPMLASHAENEAQERQADTRQTGLIDVATCFLMPGANRLDHSESFQGQKKAWS